MPDIYSIKVSIVMEREETWRERLADAIHSRGVKITRMSTDLGLHRDYISNVLSGKAKPNADRLRAICDHIDVSIAYILTGTGDKEPGTSKEALPDDLQQMSLNTLRHLVRSGEFTNI
jgi:transcriptional regulator with XRE-family HTH domain